jgi:hypothetical protein
LTINYHPGLDRPSAPAQAFAIRPDRATGSPSFAAWQFNAIHGISNGFATVGNQATDPTPFQTITSTSVRDMILAGEYTS